MTHKFKTVALLGLIVAVGVLASSHVALAYSGSISATPNSSTCGSFQTSSGSQSCSVVIGWSTPAAQYDIIDEGVNGGTPGLYSCSQGSYTEAAANYSAGNTYSFVLYAASTATNCNNGVPAGSSLSTVSFTPSAGSIANCDAGSGMVVPNTSNSHAMYAGQTYQIKVTCANDYEDTWSQANNYKLVPISATNTPTTIWGISSVSFTGSDNSDKTDNVADGSSKNFIFNVTAPSSNGTYSFHVQMYEGNASINTGNTAVSVTVTSAPIAPTCTGGTIASSWTTATSGTLAVTASGVAHAGSVSVDVFADPYSGTDLWTSASQSGTTWTANISLGNPTNLGKIDVMVYMWDTSGGEQTNCASLFFNRLNTGTININSNMPTTWTISCPLTTPTCPNINQSTSSSSQTYTSQPFSTWTITPATIPGYTVQVTPSTGQTFQ